MKAPRGFRNSLWDLSFLTLHGFQRGAQSTDANVPISMGIPALAIPGGGKSENNHSPGETFDPTDAYMGPQIAFLTILGFVGVEGASDPLLPKRK
jgi:hypothetical protein